MHWLGGKRPRNPSSSVLTGPHTPVNGGLPQLMNMTKHLAQWRLDIARQFPSPDFDGVVSLDWEMWFPLWEVNAADPRLAIYANKSRELVRQERPVEHTLRRLLISYQGYCISQLRQVPFSYQDDDIYVLTLAGLARPPRRWRWRSVQPRLLSRLGLCGAHS